MVTAVCPLLISTAAHLPTILQFVELPTVAVTSEADARSV